MGPVGGHRLLDQPGADQLQGLAFPGRLTSYWARGQPQRTRWHDPDLGRPTAAPLDQCAGLLGVDLATVRELADGIEPYLRDDGATIVDVHVRVEQPVRPHPAPAGGG
jgi:hypothetical protein